MLNTFDQSRSQEERRQHRQRQIAMMDSIGCLTAETSKSVGSGSVEGVNNTSTNSTGSRSSRSSQGNRSKRLSGTRAPSNDTIEKAKRFLWEEDDTSMLEVHPHPESKALKNPLPDMSTNLKKSATSQKRTEKSNSVGGFFASFSRKKETKSAAPVNLAPRRQSKDQLDFAGLNLDDLSTTSSEDSNYGFFAHCKASLYENRKQIFVMTILACAIGACAAVFGPRYLIPGSSQSVPQSVRNTERYYDIKEKILASGVSSEAEVMKRGSPQHEALLWIAEVDEAKLDVNDEMLVQRYSLAVFYYTSYVSDQKKNFGNFFGSSTISMARSRSSSDEQRKIWKNSKNWMSKKGFCSWSGVGCHHRPGTKAETIHYDGNYAVTHLNLTKNEIKGQIPDEIAAFTDLRLLHLGDNKMTGEIPDAIGNLDKLVVLYLGDNQFSGPIPSSLGKLDELTHLYLYGNQLKGDIPAELNNAKELRSLSLYNNKLSGGIPDLSKLTHLSDLYLDNNNLKGKIPAHLGKLKRVKDMRLSRNGFSGPIPDEIGDMDSLESLYLDRNELTGKLPEALSQLDHLEKFHAYENKLKGHLPYQLGSLENLQVLYLDNNQLSGSIPHAWGGNKIRVGMQDLEELYLHKNKINGKIPTEMGNMEDMRNLQLHDNQIEGPIPSEMGKMFKLKYAYLENNKLTGQIPKEIGKLSYLERLRINGNKITGEVSDDVCDLSSKSGGKLIEFHLDCSGNNPEVKCDCCTKCS